MPETTINKYSHTALWKRKIRFTWQFEASPPSDYAMLPHDLNQE
jgi:hypothetical protein